MNPFSSESRLTDTPSSCSFAIYKFIHIFNNLYCREKREWVNETDVGSKARWELVLTVNHTSWLCLYTWTSAWLVWFDGHNNRPEGSEVTSERVVRVVWLAHLLSRVCLRHSCVLYAASAEKCRKATLSEWTITSQEHCALSQSCILTQPSLRSTEHNLSLDKWLCLLRLLSSDWYDFRLNQTLS